jgi:UDP-2,3-diacylglucosamine hydrolase
LHHTLFISDLHLEPNRPDITACFLRFLKENVNSADALYILGDLFEAWIGDDVPSEFNRSIENALAEIKIPVYFMHGNRDFLIGKQFAKHANCTLLPDPYVLTLYDKKIVLTHGDMLCTDDKKHQQFRKYAHNPKYYRFFLMLPWPFRQWIARKIRNKSRQHTQRIAYEVMDVNHNAVNDLIHDTKTKQIIHGHTHRPNIHHYNGFTRIVLGDWHNNGSVLIYKENGEFELKTILSEK